MKKTPKRRPLSSDSKGARRRSPKPSQPRRPAANPKPERANERAKTSSRSAGAVAKDAVAAPVGAAEPEHHHEVEPHREPSPFPIVGIGASAGGIEAIEHFLRRVPERSGVAFVVILHLDPDHRGNLVALLQRTTSMPVVEVQDGLKAESNQVHVIPPGKDLSILHGVLHLLPQQAPRGLNLPIDMFFRSLAEDQQERSIGVVLSGMGSDGTLGLRAIKEKAGASFVQSLDSAKFDGMPRSAIDAGLADVVVPIEELAARIMAYLEHTTYIKKRHEEPIEEKAKSALEKIFILLRSHTGNDFTLYKKSTIHRRIERRMGLHQIDRIENYVRYLRENPREIDLLFKELLIGVTSFFRDPPAWDHLRNEVMPQLFAARSNGAVLRAWVPGCSTGEEAYSIAIVFKEALEAHRSPKNLSLQVFATDLDREGIDKARHGAYPANIAADVAPERLRRFFIQDERGYRVSKDIRDMVVFAPQNIIMDPPFTRLDLLSCRNLLIYLAPELQKKLIPLFHYTLNPGGVLFLGSAETVGTFSGLFVPADGKSRIYRRLEGAVSSNALVDFPAAFASKPQGLSQEGGPETPARLGAPGNLQVLANHLIVQRFAPATILSSDKGEILYISGRTGKYLEPAMGRASMNLFAMAREGLRLELSTAFSAALREDRAITVRGVKVASNGGSQTVNLTVQRLTEPKELRGTVMVVIADVADGYPEAPKHDVVHRKTATGSRLTELEKELLRAQEEIQTTREEMQTSQEELKSTNEELQSTNEELQSTNEELTTSKEEMQSMNEELQTVNHELQSKVDELSRSSNDMKNLLNSTDIATLFLDSDLRVRRFTTPTTSIIKLIASDAGRPISDIARDIEYQDLVQDAREVLRTLAFKEKLVTATNQRWFSVRIMPYRTQENVIDGVVITFTDTTAAKSMEAALVRQASALRQMAESLPSLVWGARGDGSCDYVSPQWTVYTGIRQEDLLGHAWLDVVHDEDRERVQARWQEAVKSGTPVDFELRIRGKNGRYRWFKSSTAPIRDAQGGVLKWYGTNSDIDDLRRAVEERKEAVDRLLQIVDQMSDPFFALGKDEHVATMNGAAERLLGRPRDQVVGKAFFDVLPAADGSAFRDNIRRAVAAGQDACFEAEIPGTPPRGKLAIRVFPNSDGMALFFGSAIGTGPVHGPDGGGEAGEQRG
jgi:two-component system CheB/CheR fusion protein